MNCEACRKAQSRFLDGELPPSQSGEMLDHAASCAECRVFFHGLVVLNQKIGHLPEPVALPEAEHIPALSRQRPLRASRLWQQRMSLRVPAFALTVCIVAALAVLSFAQLRRPEPVYITELPTLVVSADTTSAASVHSPDKP